MSKWLQPLAAFLLVACNDAGGHRSTAVSVPDNQRLEKTVTPQGIARQTTPSVVVLTMRDENGQPMSLGTGFVVATGIIVTNAHVIMGASNGDAKSIADSSRLPITGVVAVDQVHDVALLSIPTSAPPLNLGVDDVTEIGESVFVLGNPEGLEGTFSTGILSAKRALGEDTLLQITAPISPGSSGGPVLNARGNVVGVAAATFREGQNLNFAIPARRIAMLLAKREAPAPLSSVKRPKSNTSLAGQDSRAVVGENFQWAGEYDFESGYTISLRNKSTDNINNVLCLVIFYDVTGKPIETDLVGSGGMIPAGLAQRVSSRVDPSVKRLTTLTTNGLSYRYQPHTRIDYRVLNYDIVK